MNWIESKPHVVGVFVWWLLTFGFCFGAGAVLTITDAPIAIWASFATLALIAIACGIPIARARLRYNDTYLESRYFRTIRKRWDEIEAWSQLGENGSLFIRFKDGTTIGSDGWSINDSDVQKLVPILQSVVGDPRTGDDMVMPWYVETFFGGLIRMSQKHVG